MFKFVEVQLYVEAGNMRIGGGLPSRFPEISFSGETQKAVTLFLYLFIYHPQKNFT